MSNRGRIVLSIVVSSIVVALAAVFIAASGRSTPMSATASAVSESTRTITVVGQGTASTKPNLAQASIGVDVSAPTATEAVKENSDKMAAVIARLKELGISDQDIQTTSYSISPERNPDTNSSGQPVSYRVTNMVQATIRDLNQVGAILDQATQAGANSIFGVSFGLDDTARLKAEAEARGKAVADAKARADDLAKLSGVQRGEVQSISEVIGANPIPLAYPSATAFASAVPIQPGDLEVHVQVQVTYTIQ